MLKVLHLMLELDQSGSIRIISQMLNNWKCELTKTELSLLNDYCNEYCQPMLDDPLPVPPFLTDEKIKMFQLWRGGSFNSHMSQ